MLKLLYRPGYFGRRRDAIVADLNAKYGDSWRIVWCAAGHEPREFEDACVALYEESYLRWFVDKESDLDFICSFAECIDNAPSNIESGCNYLKQEAFSTHIQDIAIRNVLKYYGRSFSKMSSKILVIRSADSDGYRYGPGNIPFYDTNLIVLPSKAPRWANSGSVEDFWQSNKYIGVIE